MIIPLTKSSRVKLIDILVQLENVIEAIDDEFFKKDLTEVVNTIDNILFIDEVET